MVEIVKLGPGKLKLCLNLVRVYFKGPGLQIKSQAHPTYKLSSELKALDEIRHWLDKKLFARQSFLMEADMPLFFSTIGTVE